MLNRVKRRQRPYENLDTEQTYQELLVAFCCSRKRGGKDHVPADAVNGPEAGP